MRFILMFCSVSFTFTAFKNIMNSGGENGMWTEYTYTQTHSTKHTCAASLSCSCSTISAMVDLFSLRRTCTLENPAGTVIRSGGKKEMNQNVMSTTVQTKSHPPPERLSECSFPVSCSLDSCLSSRCRSLSLRLPSWPP